MESTITMAQIQETADYLRNRIPNSPRVGIVLGSGLADLAEAAEHSTVILAEEVPNWKLSTVQGHAGKLVFGELEDQMVMILQGRVHYYEGYRMDEVTFYVRVMKKLGVEVLILTNAAGAINPDYSPGEIMLLTDHIALIGMAGLNPLRGPNLDEFGPRFPDMSQPYDRKLADLARKSAQDCGILLHEGVYVCLAGPSFESPADLRFLRAIGADAVGMSTVPETITARHSNIKVLAISGISNKANLDGNTLTTHEEVLAAGKEIAPKLEKVIRGVLRGIDQS